MRRAFDYGKEVPGGKETDLRKAIAKVRAPRESLFITTKIRAGLDILHGAKLCIGLDADYALSAVRACAPVPLLRKPLTASNHARLGWVGPAVTWLS